MAKFKPYRYPLYLLCRLLAGVVLVMPKILMRGIAIFLSRVGFAVLTRQRNRAIKNLKTAFWQKTEEEIQEIAKKVFENLGLVAVEALQFPRLKKADAEEMIEPGEAVKLYDGVLKEGKGIISVTAHLGNWELLAGYFGLLGYQGAVLARRIYYERYNNWIVGLRNALNVRTIYRDRSSREIFSLLAKNQIVGILPDQDLDRFKGIFVSYLGRPAYTPVAPAKISLTSGAPIVTNFMIRKPDGKYKIVIGEIIRPRYDIPRDRAIQEMTVRWMQSFERVIRAYPEQWVWVHNRWRTQPENLEPKLKRKNWGHVVETARSAG